MADKYIKFDDTGKTLTEVEATVESAGSGNAGELVALGTDGKLDETVMPTGVSAETVVCVASEELSANDVVNLYDDSGTLKCRKADASDTTKQANGYVKAAVTSGSNATVYLDGELPGTSLTKGSRYFLSETAGAVTATPPTTSGAIVQCVGYAVSASAIKFDPDEMFIVRA